MGRANEWPPETWKQQEMVPAVARLMHLCTGLWDTDEGRIKDQQSPEDAAWNTINRSKWYSEAPTVKLRARSNLQELSDSEDDGLLEDDDDVEVLVGPTHLAVKPLRLEDQTLPHTCCDGSIVHMPLMSGPRCMILSEAMRLSNARSWQAPLSFGSVLHLSMGKKASCRPCMFERWAGRCTKSWLCDFCHLDVSERQLRVGKGSSKGSNR